MFRRRWNRTADAEHVFIYGETGSGKTELELRLLNSEPHAVAFATKRHDPIFKSPLVKGWTRAKQWKPQAHEHHIILAADGKTFEDFTRNSAALFPNALRRIIDDRNWTVGFDETMYMHEKLRLSNDLSAIAYTGRSMGITGIFCSQRPRRIPVIIPQSAEHAFLSRSRRDDDLSVLSELGRDKREIKSVMSTFTNKHDFLYIDTQDELPLMVVNTHN